MILDSRELYVCGQDRVFSNDCWEVLCTLMTLLHCSRSQHLEAFVLANEPDNAASPSLIKPELQISLKRKSIK